MGRLTFDPVPFLHVHNGVPIPCVRFELPLSVRLRYICSTRERSCTLLFVSWIDGSAVCAATLIAGLKNGRGYRTHAYRYM